jgi:hypothetical protein
LLVVHQGQVELEQAVAQVDYVQLLQQLEVADHLNLLYL